MSDATHFEEPSIPYPPRFWWLKRIVFFSILLVIAFAGLLQWWAYESHQRLQAEIDAIHARGEPILVEDFQVKPVPDEFNAALSLIAAQSPSVLNAAQQSFLNNYFDVDSAADGQTKAFLGQISLSTTTAQQLARKARFQPQADWGIRITSPSVKLMLPNLGAQRQLASMLSADAMYEHLNHRDAEAIEIVRDMLRQSDLLEQHSPALVTHLVAVAINSQVFAVTRRISLNLDVLQNSVATTSPSSAASRRQVLDLMNELLNDHAYRQGGRRAMLGERTFQYDSSVTPAGRAAFGVAVAPNPILGHLGLLQPMFEIGRDAHVANNGFRRLRDIGPKLSSSQGADAGLRCCKNEPHHVIDVFAIGVDDHNTVAQPHARDTLSRHPRAANSGALSGDSSLSARPRRQIAESIDRSRPRLSSAGSNRSIFKRWQNRRISRCANSDDL